MYTVQIRLHYHLFFTRDINPDYLEVTTHPDFGVGGRGWIMGFPWNIFVSYNVKEIWHENTFQSGNLAEIDMLCINFDG